MTSHAEAVPVRFPLGTMTPMLSGTLLRTQSDARLVALVQCGHERAFDAIVERYRKPLWRYCRRLLGEARAEDAVQQALMNTWSALRAGAQVKDLRAWLYRVAHNAAVDIVRGGSSVGELSESIEAPSTPDADVEQHSRLHSTLSGIAALPSRQRTALLATAIDGRDQADLARELGVSHGAVRQLVHVARTTLRAAATALTPSPLANWIATAGAGGEPAKITEMASSAGGAGLAGALLKTGAAVIATGTLITAAPAVIRSASREHTRRARQSLSANMTPASRPPWSSGIVSGSPAAVNHSLDHEREGAQRDGQGHRPHHLPDKTKDLLASLFFASPGDARKHGSNADQRLAGKYPAHGLKPVQGGGEPKPWRRPGQPGGGSERVSGPASGTGLAGGYGPGGQAQRVAPGAGTFRSGKAPTRPGCPPPAAVKRGPARRAPYLRAPSRRNGSLGPGSVRQAGFAGCAGSGHSG